MKTTSFNWGNEGKKRSSIRMNDNLKEQLDSVVSVVSAYSSHEITRNYLIKRAIEYFLETLKQIKTKRDLDKILKNN